MGRNPKEPGYFVRCMRVDESTEATKAPVTVAPPGETSTGAPADARADADAIAARLDEMIATSRVNPTDGDSPPQDRAPDDTSKHILLGPALARPDRFQSRFGQTLIERGLITRDELHAALLRQTSTGERLGEALVALGAVASVDVTRLLAEHLRLPFVDLRDDGSDSTLVGRISAEVARRFVAMPVARWGERIVMAMANPNDADMVEELRLLVNAPIVAAVADPGELRKMIATVYGGPASSTEPAGYDATVPEGAVAFTCPGCQQRLALQSTPWVMMELQREPGRYYVWDNDPAVEPPAHTCART
jgi:MshEN domain